MAISGILSRTRTRLRQLLGRRTYEDNPWQETQDAFMENCLTKHNVTISGVLHIGGHLGEEYPIYKKFGAKRIVFFEPMPDIFSELRKRQKGRDDVTLVKKALGSKKEKRQIYVGKGAGESTSFLKPSALYDGHFKDKPIDLEVITLDSFLPSLSESHIYDMLVTDAQGFDLEVLKGSQITLKQIKYLYTEVSKGHYDGEPALEDFDLFLQPFGFRRAELSLYGNWKGKDQWGDVFYIREG